MCLAVDLTAVRGPMQAYVMLNHVQELDQASIAENLPVVKRYVECVSADDTNYRLQRNWSIKCQSR